MHIISKTLHESEAIIIMHGAGSVMLVFRAGIDRNALIQNNYLSINKIRAKK